MMAAHLGGPEWRNWYTHQTLRAGEVRRKCKSALDSIQLVYAGVAEWQTRRIIPYSYLQKSLFANGSWGKEVEGFLSYGLNAPR